VVWSGLDPHQDTPVRSCMSSYWVLWSISGEILSRTNWEITKTKRSSGYLTLILWCFWTWDLAASSPDSCLVLWLSHRSWFSSNHTGCPICHLWSCLWGLFWNMGGSVKSWAPHLIAGDQRHRCSLCMHHYIQCSFATIGSYIIVLRLYWTTRSNTFFYVLLAGQLAGLISGNFTFSCTLQITFNDLVWPSFCNGIFWIFQCHHPSEKCTLQLSCFLLRHRPHIHPGQLNSSPATSAMAPDVQWPFSNNKDSWKTAGTGPQDLVYMPNTVTQCLWLDDKKQVKTGE